MERYMLKLNTVALVLAIALLAGCTVAVVFCVLAILKAQLAVDYFSNIFLLLLNALIIFSVAWYLLKSGYKLTDDNIIVQTAFFIDLIKYYDIRKIYYFATEDELYLELSGQSHNIVKINIPSGDISRFTQELKKRIPHIPYEVSLRMESDIE
mgnify:FL=1